VDGRKKRRRWAALKAFRRRREIESNGGSGVSGPVRRARPVQRPNHLTLRLGEPGKQLKAVQAAAASY